MASPDWSYHRNGCRTCARAQDFMKRHKVKPAVTIVDARKTRIGEADALKLSSEVEEIYATRGTKVVHIDMKKDKPSKDTLIGLLIGPSGNLRAPTFKVGKKLLVGFDDSAYAHVLK
jgi:arsenate reductase-like glutaredoxin family protein